jgi:hypothetical protein
MRAAGCWLIVAALAALTAGCGPHPVPTRPSWDQDVFPILQGNCNHCHGASVGQRALPATRLDICDLAAFKAMGFGMRLTFGADYLVAGPTPGQNLRDYITPTASGGRPPMPPPPGPRLGDYDVKTLLRWAQTGVADCRKQTVNTLATAKVVSGPKQDKDNKLVVVLEVGDPDGDQVLGKIKVGSVEKDIVGVGRWTIDVTGASATDAITVDLFDGYAPVHLTPAGGG